jgi:hypothetical protein
VIDEVIRSGRGQLKALSCIQLGEPTEIAAAGCSSVGCLGHLHNYGVPESGIYLLNRRSISCYKPLNLLNPLLNLDFIYG